MLILWAVFRIRIRKRWSGSGYQKINRDKLAYKSTKIIKKNFLRNHLFCLIYANNKLKITKKNIVMSFKPYTEKIKKKKIGICSILGRIRIRIRIHHRGSGSADPDQDPDPHQNDTDPKHWLWGHVIKYCEFSIDHLLWGYYDYYCDYLLLFW